LYELEAGTLEEQMDDRQTTGMQYEMEGSLLEGGANNNMTTCMTSWSSHAARYSSR